MAIAFEVTAESSCRDLELTSIIEALESSNRTKENETYTVHDEIQR